MADPAAAGPRAAADRRPPVAERAERADVAVVGGGVIGAAAALGLARQGHSVLLVEPRRPRAEPGRLGPELRTLAVSPASRALLDSLGVWGSLPLAPYRRMEVWEERGTRAMEFDAADLGRAELGWIVENGPLCVALWERLERMPGVSVVAAGVTAVQPAPGPASDEIRLIAGDRTLAVRLLLAADGAASTVRRLLDVAVRTWDVGHAALATAARFERPHEGVAYQRFLLDGPVALLPTAAPDTCSVIWSQSPDQARRRAALDDAAFAAELERALQHRLGAVTALDRRITFPLQQQLAASFNPHPRVLLLGDAARVVHPLAGLGANLGLEDVRAVLTALGAAGRGGDPGAAGRWRAFDRRRTARSRLMLDVMLGLRHVYARGDPLSQWLRNLGVNWLNRAAPVKRQIMLEALGLGPVASS